MLIPQRFEMDDGTIFDYQGSWCTNGLNTSLESKWHANCSNGGAFWDGAEKMYYENLIPGIEKTGLSDDENTLNPKIKSIYPFQLEKTGHLACITEMFNALSSGSRPQTDCRDNIKSIEMVYKSIESAKTNKIVLV